MNDEIPIKHTKGLFTAFLQGKNQTVNQATWTARPGSLAEEDLHQILGGLEPDYGEVDRWQELIAKLRDLGWEI